MAVIFKVGDKIKLLEGWDDECDESFIEEAYNGLTGKICDIPINEGGVGIDFGEEINSGHDCNGKCEYGSGQYIKIRHIKLLKRLNKKEYLKSYVNKMS